MRSELFTHDNLEVQARQRFVVVPASEWDSAAQGQRGGGGAGVIDNLFDG